MPLGSLKDRGLHLVARGLCAVPPALQVALDGGPIVRDGQTFEPELRFLLRVTAWLEPRAPESLAQYRARQNGSARAGGGRPPGPTPRALVVAGRPAWHYAGPPGAPLLVFLHGGGFVFGDLGSHDAPCRLLAHHGEMHVLAIDYRLAPEHRFPAAVEDAVAALRWAQDNAVALGADPARVGIGGDSAGGNLSAVVAQETRGDRPPAAQLLIYPATTRRRPYRSLELFAEGFFLTREAIDWFFAQYTGPDYRHPEGPDPRLDPLEAADLAGLAPALVVTAGFDPLRDEGEAYAEALRAAGNVAVTRRFPSLLHGFLNMAGVSRVCRDAVVELAGRARMLFAS